MLATTRGPVHADHVVNAAGLASDEIDRLFGHDEFTVTPRRGELIVYDKLARPLVRHILLPVPTARTKGVLVSPTVFGNVVLGPTAEDVDDKHATGVDARRTRGVGGAGPAPSCRRSSREEVTAVYVGLRAATEHGDYQIRFHPAERYVCVGGIRSTGLTASMAIAEYVLEGLRDAGLKLAATRRRAHCAHAEPRRGGRAPVPVGGADRARPGVRRDRLPLRARDARRDPRRARSGVPPRRHSTVSGAARGRCLGRCQGFYCGATVAALLAEATGGTIDDVLGVPGTAGPRARA